MKEDAKTRETIHTFCGRKNGKNYVHISIQHGKNLKSARLTADMEIKIEINDEIIEKVLGKITRDEFADFCKQAIASKLFEELFRCWPAGKEK